VVDETLQLFKCYLFCSHICLSVICLHNLKLSLDNRIVKYYIGFMNKYERQKLKVETLPDSFKMSDKSTLIMIRDLFEMIKDNNELIQLMDKKIKILELKLKN
jgi:hypothetical protein